jgi:hypothetical protein
MWLRSGQLGAGSSLASSAFARRQLRRASAALFPAAKDNVMG